jgi:hypothetical protein
MRARTRPLVLAMFLVGLLWSPSSASAYCDPLFYEISGRCDNSCTYAARAFAKATGKPAPWDCLM